MKFLHCTSIAQTNDIPSFQEIPTIWHISHLTPFKPHSIRFWWTTYALVSHDAVAFAWVMQKLPFFTMRHASMSSLTYLTYEVLKKHQKTSGEYVKPQNFAGTTQMFQSDSDILNLGLNKLSVWFKYHISAGTSARFELSLRKVQIQHDHCFPWPPCAMNNYYPRWCFWYLIL